MKKIRLIATTMVAFIFGFSETTYAGVTCTLSSFKVVVSDAGGVYAHGSLNETNVSWIVLCGATSGSTDCSNKASDRMLAASLAAQLSGKSLSMYFNGISSCSSFTPYMAVSSFEVLN